MAASLCLVPEGTRLSLSELEQTFSLEQLRAALSR
jgi:hypothetical protein